MKLNTDNPQTMPVTDAVYGRPPKHADKPVRQRRERSLQEAVTQEVLDELHAMGQKNRRKR